jgi:hypothetical protein
MKNLCLARAALAAALIVGATSALAQGFGSISSGGPAWRGSQPPAAEPAQAAPSAPASESAVSTAVTTTEVAPAPAPASVPVPVPATPQPAAFSSGAPAAVPAAEPAATAVPEAPGSAPTVSTPAPAPASASVTVPFGSVSSAGMPPPLAPGGQYQMADRVVVKTSERRLYLMRANQIVAEYPIRLGLNPTGHKLREGDFRTPEGSYELVRRNPKSEFFLSLEVSYPNESDKARAKQLGVKPGGLIMIHGQPNVRRKSPEYYENFDWTNGCIAVSNSDMVDIWLRTGVGTPIEIRP